MAEASSQATQNSRKRLFNQSSLMNQATQSSSNQYATTFPSKFEALVQELAFSNSDIMDLDKKKRAQSIIFVAKQLVSQNKFSKATLGKIIIKHKNLPLELLWLLQAADIINFSLYTALLSEQDLQSIGGRIAKLLDASKENVQGSVAAGIAIDLLKPCITLVHGPQPPTILNPVRKSCRTLLSQVLKKVMFPLDDTDEPAPWWFIQLAKVLPSVIFRPFAESLLESQLTAPPLISVHQALARQSEWKDSRKSFDLVFQCCGSSTDALNALVKILNDTREVNWKAVLISVSSFLHLFSDSKDKLLDLISAWLTQSLSNEDNETLLLSFILARQLSHSCPPSPYANWFKKSFAHRQTTLCKSNQQFQFLLEFLTQLVPHEPATCLKAHHDFPPFVPPNLKEKLQDFLMVASSRLKDLNPTNDIGIFQADQIIKSVAEQVQFDVLTAISSFKSTNKVHERLLSATIFKKKYYESNFLPSLLTPREGIRSNDPQVRLVDSLLKIKKISTAQYETFQAKCLEQI